VYLIPEASGGLSLVFRRWATKKTAGSTKNGRDSNPKYLGVKKFGGEVSSSDAPYNFYVSFCMNNFLHHVKIAKSFEISVSSLMISYIVN
jgi:hypothetical protein